MGGKTWRGYAIYVAVLCFLAGLAHGQVSAGQPGRVGEDQSKASEAERSNTENRVATEYNAERHMDRQGHILRKPVGTIEAMPDKPKLGPMQLPGCMPDDIRNPALSAL